MENSDRVGGGTASSKSGRWRNFQPECWRVTLREAATLNLRWGLRLRPSLAQINLRLGLVVRSPEKGVRISRALYAGAESPLSPTRGSYPAPTTHPAWWRWARGHVRAQKRASVWGLGPPLRLVGQASPAEGDSPDPEGRDKLAASPHQTFARFSRVIRGTSRSSWLIALAGPHAQRFVPRRFPRATANAHPRSAAEWGRGRERWGDLR